MDDFRRGQVVKATEALSKLISVAGPETEEALELILSTLRSRGSYLPPGWPPPVFVRAAEAASMLGVSRGTFYELLRSDATFPRPVRLTEGGFPRWRPRDLEAWAMSRQDPTAER